MTARKLTIKDRILNLLRKGTPMLSMEMSDKLKISKAAASMAAKELHEAGWIYVAEWRHNAKNGGNKVYALGEGKDATKPEPKYKPRDRSIPADDKPFVPHADVAAAWMMTK